MSKNCFSCSWCFCCRSYNEDTKACERPQVIIRAIYISGKKKLSAVVFQARRVEFKKELKQCGREVIKERRLTLQSVIDNPVTFTYSLYLHRSLHSLLSTVDPTFLSFLKLTV